MEELNVFISVIASAVALVVTIYEFVIKFNKREKGYYEKVLKPYIVELSKNKEIKTVKTLKKLVNRADDDIPKYITYLIDKNKEKKLRKVLICDYIDIYPNSIANTNKITDGISGLVYYILFFGGFFLFVLGAILFSCGTLGILVEICNTIICKEFSDSIRLYILSVLLGVGISFFSILIVKSNDSEHHDRYTLNKKKIESMIKEKIKRYDKKICEHSQKYFY